MNRLLCGCVLAAGLGATVRAETIPAHDARVLVEGRSVATERGGVKLAFPGVDLHLAVTGPALTMRADASGSECDFDVIVDGRRVRRVRLPPGEHETELFAAAAAGPHRVEVVHVTETWNGGCEVEAFTAAGGFGSADPLPTRRLVFIGDSFTCGAAAEVRPGEPVDPVKSRRQNARLSFGWRLARALGAQVELVAFGGRGLMRDWQGAAVDPPLPEIYERTLADDPAARWTPAAGTAPEAIVVCAGNDFDSGIPDEAAYERTAAAFVRTLRRDAPHAAILLVVSPVLFDPPSGAPRRSVLRGYLETVAAQVRDPGVTVLDLGTCAIVPGDGHPDGPAHEAFAARLEPRLRQALAGHEPMGDASPGNQP